MRFAWRPTELFADSDCASAQVAQRHALTTGRGLSVVQTVRATKLATRDRQPALEGRCSTHSGLTSSDHPDPRGLHPGLFYSTLSASSVSIAAGICEASRHRRVNGLNGMVTLSPRAQYVGLDPEGGRTDQPGVQTPGRVGSAARPNPEGVGQRSPDETTSLRSPLSESQEGFHLSGTLPQDVLSCRPVRRQPEALCREKRITEDDSYRYSPAWQSDY